MDDKEATSVEGSEETLPPMEPTRPTQQEEQPEKPVQTEVERFQEVMRAIMENNKTIESLNKKIDDDNNRAVSYTHLDVYKRQMLECSLTSPG